jgi:hypothetical protein
MAVLKIRDPADPTGQTWIDIAGVGPAGADGVNGSGTIELYNEVASVVSHATINTFVVAATGTFTVVPSKRYHVMAGIRGISDAGAAALAQMQVGLGAFNCSGYDVVDCRADAGLWGAWSQQWVADGSAILAAGGDVVAELRVMVSVTARTIYSPRLTIIGY